MENLFRVDGRKALVTGASRGIGRAVALLLAGAGAEVILVSRDEEALRSLADGINSSGGKAHIAPGDVGNPESVESVFEKVGSITDTLDILVNNAGISPHYKSFEKSPEEDWDRMYAVNLRGVFLTTKKAFPYLAKRGGSVINVSSIGGIIGLPRIAVYSATKGALTTFTKSLAWEWARHGIRVNAVCPGFVETEMTAGIREHDVLREQCLSRIPLGRFAKPEEIARVVLFLASPASSYVTGHLLIADGGWTAG
ncbi:MAG: SDR family oxidoreductase [Deltaproteobacteria bacterium]|nr:MAG: SDR family oxidoreductase [Deltaproteobacteria bacterium]